MYKYTLIERETVFINIFFKNIILYPSKFNKFKGLRANYTQLFIKKNYCIDRNKI